MSDAFAPPGGFDLYGEPGTFMGLNGPLYVSPKANGEVLTMRAEAQHANAGGVVGGGFVMTLLAATMGVAVSAACKTTGHCPALEIDSRFLGFAKVGQVLIGVAEVERVTRAVVFASATLTADGQIVGKASGVFSIPPAVAAEIAARKAQNSPGDSQ